MSHRWDKEECHNIHDCPARMTSSLDLHTKIFPCYLSLNCAEKSTAMTQMTNEDTKEKDTLFDIPHVVRSVYLL